MRGKEKCKALKEIRRQIAEENDIAYAVSECTHQGECRGTCPKCEAELRYLERELAIRQGLGKAVAVVGISTSVCAGLTACSPVERVEDFVRDVLRNAGGVEETEGALAAPEETPEPTATEVPTASPVPEVPECEPGEIETPFPEILEGDVAIFETPIPNIEGELLPAPEDLEETVETEDIKGEIAIPEDGWE